jgi:hypothetical protein
MGDEATMRDTMGVAILGVVSLVLVAVGWVLGTLVIALVTGGHWMAIVLPLLPSAGLTLWLSRGDHA